MFYISPQELEFSVPILSRSLSIFVFLRSKNARNGGTRNQERTPISVVDMHQL